MPNKDFQFYLKGGCKMYVSIAKSHGEVVDFVVRLVDARGENEHDLARYDTAHGRPHLDILTPAGNLKEKIWMPTASLDVSLTQAIEDFKNNHENYLHDR